MFPLNQADENGSVGIVDGHASERGQDCDSSQTACLADQREIEVNDVLAAAFLENVYGDRCRDGQQGEDRVEGLAGKDWQVRVWKRIISLCKSESDRSVSLSAPAARSLSRSGSRGL